MKERLFSAEGTGEFLGIPRRKRLSAEGVLCRCILKKIHGIRYKLKLTIVCSWGRRETSLPRIEDVFRDL